MCLDVSQASQTYHHPNHFLLLWPWLTSVTKSC
jgi:hypothetical protein